MQLALHQNVFLRKALCEASSKKFNVFTVLFNEWDVKLAQTKHLISQHLTGVFLIDIMSAHI